MSTKRKVIGEGGAHSHRLTSGTTENDGIHKHIFFVNDRLLMTDLSGSHSHSVSAQKNEVGGGSPHEHLVQVKTTEGLLEFKTQNASPHGHELQVENTTLSGVHVHEVEINDEIYMSMVPADLIEAIEQETAKVASLQKFNVRKSDDTLECDFQAVQRLNKDDFKDIMKAASVRALFKSLTRISEGFQIESMVLSRERFTDIGVARRFLMDNGLNVKSSEERDGSFVFQVHSKERFVETSLHRINITDGVVAVVGLLRDGEPGQQMQEPEVQEGKAEDALTENATEAEEKPGATGTVDEMTDVLNSGTEQKSKKSVAEMFAEACKAYGIVNEKHVQKNSEATIQILKVDKKLRLFTSAILVPENFDLQDDVVSVDEIRKAVHNYMIKLAFRDDPEFLESLELNDKSERGFMHVEFQRRICFVEVWLAPMDMTFIDDSGEEKKIKQGTAIGTAKVFDDETWALIEAGKITGFSIGGRSKVLPA